MSSTRTPYPSDVSDEEWSFVAPYLALLPEDVSQRKHELREAFNGLRYLVKTGVHWRMLPHDLPPWPVVYQQMRRWLAAECFEAIVHDLRVLLRRAAERTAQPSAAILDSRTVQSTPESGARAWPCWSIAKAPVWCRSVMPARVSASSPASASRDG